MRYIKVLIIPDFSTRFAQEKSAPSDSKGPHGQIRREFGQLCGVSKILRPYTIVPACFQQARKIRDTLRSRQNPLRILSRNPFGAKFAIAKFGIMLLALGIIWTKVSFSSDTLTPEEIIRACYAHFYYAGNDMKSRILMKLIDKGGQERIRDLTMLRKNYAEGGGEQKYFIYFHQPSDVKDTTFMVCKYPDRDDDRWLFIPAINLVKRIAANDKYSSFVGSDFSYEDVSGRKLKEDSYRLLKEEELNSKVCYVIESLPKGSAEYTKRISWIDKVSYLPLKEEFYDKQNELYKQFEAQEIKDVSGVLTITKRVMRNVKTGHRTEVTFQVVQYDLGIEDDIFSEQYLRRPPLQWIR